jgi:hypothetical protein
MASFLFWNLRGRQLESVLGRLTARHGVDVLILAECAIPEEAMLNALDAAGRGPFHCLPPIASRGLDLYSRYDKRCFGPVLKEADNYLMRSLTPPQGIEIVLVVPHLASPMYKGMRRLGIPAASVLPRPFATPRKRRVTNGLWWSGT